MDDYDKSFIRKIIISIIAIIILVIIVFQEVDKIRESQRETNGNQYPFTEITCDNAGILSTDCRSYAYYYLNDTHIVYVGNTLTDSDGELTSTLADYRRGTNSDMLTPVISENGLHFIYDTETKSVIETKY
jgi:hypothetical protein